MPEQGCGDIIPNRYTITLYEDAKFEAHIQALAGLIDVENSRAAAGAMKGTEHSLVSRIDLTNTRLPLFYSGKFSQAVLRWIRTREEVKGVERDVCAGSH
jgi:hypothetical protein